MKYLLLGLLAVSSITVHAAGIIAEPFPPARLTSLYIEKDDAGVAELIQMNGDAVTYKKSTGVKVLETVTVHPGGDDWFRFIQDLNDAKVYKWTPKYYYPGQGPSWMIDFTMDDRKFGSEGINEYPKDGDEANGVADPKAGSSIAFQLFWQAALRLVGKAAPPTAPK